MPFTNICFTRSVREWNGSEAYVNENSGWYNGVQFAGQQVQGLLLPGGEETEAVEWLGAQAPAVAASERAGFVAWPNSAEEMDELLGMEAREFRISQTPQAGTRWFGDRRAT